MFEHRSPRTYLEGIDAEGQKWRARLDGIKARPVTQAALNRARTAGIKREWQALIKVCDTALEEIKATSAVAEQLVRLTLMADAASRGLGRHLD